ncbi:hypothetical protein TWF718_009850 [Orbilia javanica]|uniref:Nucleoside phosphorylase domain-containing protein n=1 Tax=Orbilia javanica TaxID=47235 RepID=A0AAN8MXA6_9PEZI
MNEKRALCGDYTETGPSDLSKRRKTWHHVLPADGVQRPAKNPSGLHPNHYTIAWICALHMEMAAAQAMLDEVHDGVATYPNDSNTYTLGSIGRHNVVIAPLPNAQYGTNSAAAVLTNLIRTFPCIRLGLIVGIGGGSPSKADVRLGDIVVGTRVMQYDLGKIVEDGEIQRTAIPRIPHSLAGTAVSALRARHERGLSRIPSILRESLDEHPTYARPDLPDQLFMAAYQHMSPAASCDSCEESKLVPRTERRLQDPVIHYGVIASGNQVMRSGNARDIIARQLDALCFEMEAAGLMDILPCLPIRGICDYSDSHKNKEWQNYAAATAAAYAKELLEVLHAPDLPTKIKEDPDLTKDSSDNRRKELLGSLRYEQIDSRKLGIKSAHAKTCSWFLNHPDYQAWLDPTRLEEHHGFLWINGKPGAGKSTIMKFIYTKTKNAKKKACETLVASFFFHARGDQLEKSISGMYRSLLLQLLEGYPDLQVVLDDTDLIPRSQTECPCLNVLKDLFFSAVSLLGQRSLICFVDALDECDEQQVRSMIQDIEGLAERSVETGISLRICFSSRHYPHIEIQQGIKLTLESQPGHSKDLESYVGSCLRIKDTALATELRLQILEKATGVFLWVVLVVGILNKENARGRLALKKRLAELPSGLSELFKDILQRDCENMEQLLICVIWILYAKEPLRPEEYYHAVWSGLFLKDLADDEIPTIAGSDTPDVINNCVISYSKGLAEITKAKQPTVQFIHESVRDFLIKDGGLHHLWPNLGFELEGPCHERLKQCCSAYMNHPEVQKGTVAVLRTLRVVEQVAIPILSDKYPFLEYATQNILIHANAAATVIPQDRFVSTFAFPEWVIIYNIFEKFAARKYVAGVDLLYVLAEKNLANLIRIHPERMSCFKIRTSHPAPRYGPPLIAALALGSHEAVQAFLETHAQHHPGSPLQELCKKYSENEQNHVSLSRAFEFLSSKGTIFHLLENGLDIVSKFLIQWVTIVDDASSDLRDCLCLSLLPSGVHRNGLTNQFKMLRNTDNPSNTLELWDRGKRSPLSCAAIKKIEAGVRLCLQVGINADSKDSTGCTALFYAAESGNEKIVQLLLEKSIQVDCIDNGESTPLLEALRGGHLGVVQRLLDTGQVNLNLKDEMGNTPLLIAAERGYESIVTRLLETVNINLHSKDSHADMPLLEATSHGRRVAAKPLLGAELINIDLKNNDGNTPLSMAVRKRHLGIVRRLLATGRVNPNFASAFGYTLLGLAAERGDEEIVKMVIETHDIDLDPQDHYGDTPLAEAARRGYQGIVKRLLDTKLVEPDSRNHFESTPLSAAACGGHHEVVKQLLDTGRVDPDSKDDHGTTPLLLAARGGHNVVVKQLLDTGRVDPDSKNDNGDTPLLLAVNRGHKEVVKQLLDTGRVSLTVENNVGSTPLSQAAAGQWEIQKLITAAQASRAH